MIRTGRLVALHVRRGLWYDGLRCTCGGASAAFLRPLPMSDSPSPPEFDRLVDGAVRAVASLARIRGDFERAADLVVGALRAGRKVLAAGNGGSAAEAMHLAEELSGRYHADRRALPGLALCADGTALTCIGNDFGFADVFARQVEAFGAEGDVLALFTTSGRSENLLRAARAARARGVRVLAFTGRGGGPLAPLADVLLDVPDADASAHVQEAHQVLLHALLEHVEAAFPPEPGNPA